MKGTWQTTDGGGGSGGLVLAVIAAAVLLGSGAASVIASALVTITIIIGVVVVLAIVGVITCLVRKGRRERPIAGLAAYQVAPEVRPHLETSSRPSIGPAREVHLHLNVTPDQLAAIMRHHLEENR